MRLIDLKRKDMQTDDTTTLTRQELYSMGVPAILDDEEKEEEEE